MAALSKSRNTPELADGGRTMVYPVEANTTVYLGSMVALNTNGNATPATAVAGLRVLGRAEMTHDGRPGQDAVNNPGVAGAISIVARRGVFLFAVNDGSINSAQVGLVAFAVDDNSVSASDGGGQTAVVGQAATFPAATSAQLVTVGHENITKVGVHSSAGGGTVYVEGSDYVVDYPGGLVMLIAGGGIADAATVYIDYNWGAPTRSAAGRVVGLDPSGQVWIDFWHQAAPVA